MDNIGNSRKICNFCGENIASDFKRCPYCGSLLELDASYSDAGSQGIVDTIDEDSEVDTADSAYRFEKSINDSNSVTDFTGKPVSSEQYLNYDDDDFALREALANREALINKADAPIENNNPEKSSSMKKPEIRPGNLAATKPIKAEVNNIYSDNLKQPLGNGMKVFMVTLSNLLPGIGQLFGVIAAIVLMNTEGDKDRKSFGVALLVSSVIAFVVSIVAFAFLILCFFSLDFS